MLFTDDIVRSNVLLRLDRSTAPRLFKTGGATEIVFFFFNCFTMIVFFDNIA